MRDSHYFIFVLSGIFIDYFMYLKLKGRKMKIVYLLKDIDGKIRIKEE